MAKLQVIKNLELRLCRFLPDFDDILDYTARFKERLAPVASGYRNQNYVEGFNYSRDLLSHLFT